MIYLYRWDENQIFLNILFFSNTDIHRFLYSLIECLQVNQKYVTSFWFKIKDLDSKLVLEKTKKVASYELDIKTVFFTIFYMNFFKREFWIFSNEHFDRLHSTKFSIATREFYIWEAILLTSLKHHC